jgi:hypothetical protein
LIRSRLGFILDVRSIFYNCCGRIGNLTPSALLSILVVNCSRSSFFMRKGVARDDNVVASQATVASAKPEKHLVGRRQMRPVFLRSPLMKLFRKLVQKVTNLLEV